MRIAVIGGGPGGLYFALLMKKHFQEYEIEVFERNGPNDTFGWGVVFSDKTLRNLEACDDISYKRITDAFAAWENVDIVHNGTKVTVHGNKFSGISRLKMLNILQQRAEELGVKVHYRTEIKDFDKIKSTYNVVVAADGVNSDIRKQYEDKFQPELSVRSNKYIWYGTHHLFHALTLTFRENEHGIFAAHSYKFNQDTSTFIIECDEQTWRNAGLDKMPEEEGRKYLEQVFKDDLEGEKLLSNNSKWINFLHVKNAHWWFDNVALLGDAVHTAHFSIGSGTKLALEDSIALFRAFEKTTNVHEALKTYEEARRPIVDEYQYAAFESLVWFENLKDVMHFPTMEFAYRVMMRSKRIDHENLRKRDPEFIRAYEEAIS